MPGTPPRPLHAAIGATEESARHQILAIGPDSPLYPTAAVGDVLVWDGTAWVPTPGAGLGADGGLIFRPGGTPGIGIVTTEAALQTAVAAHAGPVSILFDDSIVSPIHLTLPWVVLYDMRWIGKHLGTATSLILDDGFTLTGPSGQIGISSIGNGLNVQAEGLVGPIPLQLTASSDVLQVESQSGIFSGGPSPLLQIANGSRLVLILHGRLGDTTNPVLLFGLGSTMSCFVYDFGQVDDNCLSGADPASQADFGIVSPALASISLTNPSFAGAITMPLLGDAVYLAYNDLAVAPPLNATNVQAALDALKALVVSGGGSVAIWRGTGAPTAPGIFNTWAALFAWANAAPGSKHIYLDSTFGPLAVDPGLWVFNPPVEFIGSPVDPRTDLTLNESSFRNVWRWSRIKFIELNILTTPFGDFSETMEFNDCAIDMSGGAQPFIRTLVAALDVTFRHMAVSPTTQLVFDMQPTAPPCTIRLYDGTSVAVNSFSTGVGTILTLIQDASSTYTNQFFILGTLIRQLQSPSYIPGNGADWTFPPPTTVFEALDRLAAKFVASALGTP